MKKYGYPPEVKDCTKVETGPWLMEHLGVDEVNARSSLSAELLGQAVPNMSIARQVRQRFPHRNITFTIKGRGTFRVGEEGWCVE